MRRPAIGLPALAILVGIGLLACAPSGAPTSSPRASALHSASAPPAGGDLPPGCAPIDLRTLDGVKVELDGIWVQDGEDGRVPMTWWVRTKGDCVWATGIADDYTDDPFFSRADNVQHLTGTLRNDFTIASTIVLLAPHPEFVAPQIYAEVRMLVDVDPSGAITLREDREPGVGGPRCPDPVGYCPAPLVLHPTS